MSLTHAIRENKVTYEGIATAAGLLLDARSSTRGRATGESDEVSDGAKVDSKESEQLRGRGVIRLEHGLSLAQSTRM